MKENNPQEILKDILLKMNYDVSKTLSEQKPDNLMFGQSDNPFNTGKVASKLTPTDLKRGAETASKQVAELRKSLGLDDPHTWLQIGGVAAFLIPGIGAALALGLSLGFDAADTVLYWNEGNKEMAGLSALLSVLPLVGDIPGVKNFSASVIKSTKDKLKKVAQGVKNVQFLPNEMQLVSYIKKNNVQIAKSADNKIKVNLKKKKQAPAILNTIKGGAKLGLHLGAYSVASDVYGDVYQSLQSDTPKVVAQKLGYEWEYVKDAFGSDGSAKDNLLLKNALLKGWKPGDEIPEDLQTDTIKKEIDDYMSGQ
jgi:hypothetical protein